MVRIFTYSLVLSFFLFSQCIQTEQSNTVLIQNAQKQALETKSKLGAQLMNAMKSNGPEGAVAFCNTVALPLTAEVSTQFGSKIKRVTDKPRNPLNLAGTRELEVMESYRSLLMENKKIEPVLDKKDSTYTAYFPIEIASNCLACHGTVGKEITNTLYTKIKELYPEDKATGYTENQLRGLFVVEMTAKQRF